MSKEVPWTKHTLERFIEEAHLNEAEIYIMKSRIQGESVTSQSLHLNQSVATTHRMIRDLKHRYDLVQEQFPDEFPIRIKKSAKESWMDTH